ncbi:hypothetical protein DFAR_2040024 [Desulfarculales bacterium]
MARHYSCLSRSGVFHHRTRGTVLSKLVVLFGEVRENVRNSHTEIAVVLAEGARGLGGGDRGRRGLGGNPGAGEHQGGRGHLWRPPIHPDRGDRTPSGE